MGSTNLLPSTKYILNEVDEKLSSSTITELSRQDSADVGGATLAPTRSRRPTLSPIQTTASGSQRVRSQSVTVLQPAQHDKWTAKRVLKVVWAYVTTVKGFLITIYMLNIVAWGGMLFLLLVNAAPAMCYPTCNDINSPRRIWIEIDSQILNALFCVTGLGLLPWRLRDTWLLYRGNWDKLSVIHAGWYVHGVTKRTLMYAVIILFLGNSAWQIAMALTMWTLNRYERPGWTTGLCITISFLCAIFAGGLQWWEVRQRKKLQKQGKLAPSVDIAKSNTEMLERQPDVKDASTNV